MELWHCDAVAQRLEYIHLLAILGALDWQYQNHPLHGKEKVNSVKVGLPFYNLSVLVDFDQYSLKLSNQFSRPKLLTVICL